MFTVKKQLTTVERYCPSGHILPELLSLNNHLSFCYVCGKPIEERPVTYDAPYCANCNNPVVPSWNYCPYCGIAAYKHA